jgi:electron transfer flavoprotein beta subunit
VNIVVLLKAVPVVGTERLGPDLWTDRSGASEANGNDEYLLEKALKLTEEHGGEVTLLTVGPAGATEALRKALAMGASRAVPPAGTRCSSPTLTRRRRARPPS